MIIFKDGYKIEVISESINYDYIEISEAKSFLFINYYKKVWRSYSKEGVKNSSIKNIVTWYNNEFEFYKKIKPCLL